YIHVTFGVGRAGSWNDLPNIGGTNDYFPQGYMVEYGGMPGDPSLNNISASTKITILPPLRNVDIPLLRACDSASDGDDNNGFTEFDLTSREAFILSGSVASNFQVNYFTDAAYTNQIFNPTAFVNTIQNNQVIYVRIHHVSNPTCYTDRSFSIQVDALPVIQSSIIFKNCDGDANPNDGVTDFNLNEINDVVTNGNSASLEFTYYLSYNDADSKTAAINSLPFNNAMANTVFVRVENTNGCYRISTVDLQVSTTYLDEADRQVLESCDNDAVIDGLYEFDLTQASQ